MKKLLPITFISLLFFLFLSSPVLAQQQIAPKEEKLEGIVVKILEDKLVELVPGNRQPSFERTIGVSCFF